MSKYRDSTLIGGPEGSFETTHWSEIFGAATSDDDRRRIVIGSLLMRYWKPVYCYLRRKGYSNEDAKDLVQGFFQEIVLDSTLIRRADQTKGRFRTFLLTALECYVTDISRKQKAKKRLPTAGLLPLEMDDLPDLPASRSVTDPRQVFAYAWAASLVDEVIQEVKKDCFKSGKEVHWQVFNAKVLVPIMTSAKGPALGEICKKYGVATDEKASNMIVTVKRCFRRLLEERMQSYVRSDSDVEDELNDLIYIISKGGAG